MTAVVTGRDVDEVASDGALVVAATRVPPAVWSLVALHVTLLVLYSVLAPTFRAPDEYMHVDLALHVAGGGDYPRFDEQRLAAPVLRARDTSPAYLSFAPAVGEGAAAPRAGRPSFRDLGPDEPTDIVNPMPQHPPLYYALTGGVVAALDGLVGAGDWPFDRLVAVLRLLSVVLVAPLPLLAWLAARRLCLGPAAALAAAGLVLCVPSLTHLGSVVNNDNLVVLLGGGLTVLVARIATGDTSWPTALGSGLVLGLALLTKGFALILVPWLVAGYVVALAPARRWGALVTRTGVALAVALVAGGWWWARNLVVEGMLLPAAGLRDRVLVDPDTAEYASAFLDRLLTSFWGSFGWREAELPLVLVAVLSVALAAAVVLGVRAGPSRGPLALLPLPVAALAVLIAANAWRAYLKTGVPYASQGRYLFIGLLGVLVVAAASVRALPPRLAAGAPLALLAAALALHASAIVAITGRYWTGGRVGALLAFAPWPAAVVVAAAASVPVAASVAGWALRPGPLATEQDLADR